MNKPKPITRHTPGPWWGGVADSPWYVRRESDDATIAHVEDGGHCNPDIILIDDDQREANARLIAAAPDMLAALVEAKQEMWLIARHQWTMTDFKNWAVIQQIDAVLTKATGVPR